MQPVSIITINYNNATGLQKTVESVINQQFKNFEFIIIDGGSTDGSLEIIEKIQDNTTHWVSEKDTGIYNAMNKGIARAKGEFILFLNSGDTFYNAKVLANTINQLQNVDILYGNCLTEYKKVKVIIKPPNNLKKDFFTSQSINHQSAFIRRSLFETIGIYDETIGLLADQDFFIKAVNANVKYKYFNQIVSNYDGSGVSSNTDNFLKNQATLRSIHFGDSITSAKKTDDGTMLKKLIFYVTFVPAAILKKLFKSQSFIKALKYQ